VIGQGAVEAATVIAAKIFFVIIIFGEGHPFLEQNLAQQFEVERFVIDDDAVEVEDYCPEIFSHAVYSSIFSFSYPVFFLSGSAGNGYCYLVFTTRRLQENGVEGKSRPGISKQCGSTPSCVRRDGRWWRSIRSVQG